MLQIAAKSVGQTLRNKILLKMDVVGAGTGAVDVSGGGEEASDGSDDAGDDDSMVDDFIELYIYCCSKASFSFGVGK